MNDIAPNSRKFKVWSVDLDSNNSWSVNLTSLPDYRMSDYFQFPFSYCTKFFFLTKKQRRKWWIMQFSSGPEKRSETTQARSSPALFRVCKTANFLALNKSRFSNASHVIIYILKCRCDCRAAVCNTTLNCLWKHCSDSNRFPTDFFPGFMAKSGAH